MAGEPHARSLYRLPRGESWEAKVSPVSFYTLKIRKNFAPQLELPPETGDLPPDERGAPGGEGVPPGVSPDA